MSDFDETVHEPTGPGQHGDLRALADRLALDDLLSAYAAAVDARDWDLLASLFSPGAVLDYTGSGGPRGTLPEVLPFLRQGLGLFDVTQHFVTNRRIVLDGDGATSSASLFNPLGRRGDGGELRLLILGGRYETRYERTAAGWRIVEHAATVLWGPRPA